MPTDSRNSSHLAPATRRSIIAVCEALEEGKAVAPMVLDISQAGAFVDFLVIASGRSARHVSTLSEKIVLRLRSAGFPKARPEGLDTCDWVAIDTGDMAIHIFRSEVRAHYKLEKLWHPLIRKDSPVFTLLQEQGCTTFADPHDYAPDIHEDTSLEDQEHTSLEDQERTSLKDQEHASLENQERTSLKDQEHTSLEDQGRTSLEDQERTSLKDQEHAPGRPGAHVLERPRARISGRPRTHILERPRAHILGRPRAHIPGRSGAHILERPGAHVLERPESTHPWKTKSTHPWKTIPGSAHP